MKVGKIVVKRKSQWANKMREIGLYLNGKKIGTINDGETKEFEIQPGTHQISAKIDWCGSQVKDIDVHPDHKQYIELSGFKKSHLLFPGLLIFSGISLFLSYLDINANLISFAVILPMLLYMFYFVTIGRKRYLELKIK